MNDYRFITCRDNYIMNENEKLWSQYQYSIDLAIPWCEYSQLREERGGGKKEKETVHL